jgi:Abnormal spindle-like microcephaly-assoc'd, ASPM-SPD-2-Hydin
VLLYLWCAAGTNEPMTRNAMTGRPRRALLSRLASLLLVTSVGSVFVVASSTRSSSGATPPVELVSVMPQGASSAGIDFQIPSLSADGGFVAFTAYSQNVIGLAPPSASALAHLALNQPLGLVRDRAAASTAAVPVLPAGGSAMRDISAISRDGCTVVFLTTGATSAAVLLQLGAWNRCVAGANPVRLPLPNSLRNPIQSISGLTVSSHGRFVAANMSTNALSGVLWMDRDVSASGTFDTTGNVDLKFRRSTSEPSLGDESTPLVALTENGATQDVALWNPKTDAITPVSVSAGTNSPAHGRSFSPSMTPDARYVAFTSTAFDLVSPPLQPLKDPQIFVRDMTTQTTRLVSRTNTVSGAPVAAIPPGQPADGWTDWPSISADGTQVAFGTESRNLLPGVVGNPCMDCRRGDLLVVTSSAGFFDTITFDRVNVNPNGSSASFDSDVAFGPNDQPVISATGRYVAFRSGFGNQLVGPSIDRNQTNIFVVARPPAVSVSSVSFGSVRVGKTSAVKTATISNTGISSVVPAALGPTNPEFVVTATTCPLNVALTPGQSCTVSLVFKPTAEGARSGVLNLSETGFGAITVSGKLAGTGTVPPPTTTTPTTTPPPTPPTTPPTTPLVAALSIDPPAANFGTVLVGGETPPVTFTVTSTGTAGVAIASATINPGMTGDYPLAGDTCSGKTLAPGEQCQVSVVFRPSVAGDRPATLTVASPAVSVAAALDGAGSFQPVLKLSPNVVAVGQVAIAVGAGFPPGAVVQLKWSTRPEIRSVTAKADGTFQLQIPIGPDELPGPRQLQAIDIPGEFTGVQVPGLVVQRSMQPPTNKNPAFRGITSLIIRG